MSASAQFHVVAVCHSFEPAWKLDLAAYDGVAIGGAKYGCVIGPRLRGARPFTFLETTHEK
jgi:hypothetical protein